MVKIRYCRSLMSLVTRVTISQTVLLQTVIALILISVPLNAYPIDCNVSGDIPFTIASDDSDIKLCIQCSGPWARASKLVEFEPKDIPCTFYAAASTIFSPLGLWDCKLYGASDSGCVTQSTLFETKFCVTPISDDIFVDLFISANPPTMFANFSPPPCNSTSLRSFLGDNVKQEKSKPDSDEFLFDGNAGDEVMLTLRANPKEGNNGGEASLGISGNSLNESTSGALPLEIEATLPGDGEYSITVGQPKNSAESFRGSYILSVTPSTGSIDLIEPTINVEK
ncbi:MAG: hypothetical protein WBD99_12880 [Thermodesulfobacteriota bacterium]